MISIGIQVVVHDPAGGHVIHDIARLERAELSPDTLGLSLADGKVITAGIQRVIAGEPIAVWQAAQRMCRACGRSRSLKGHHRLVYRTVFGTLHLDSERLHPCPGQGEAGPSSSPLATLLAERTSPELLYQETRFASLVSYGLSARLLGELLPMERPIGAERIRRHLFAVAAAHETALGPEQGSFITTCQAERDTLPVPDGPIFVGVDGGYVRGREQGWFEVIAGKSLVSFRRDDPDRSVDGKCFALVQTVDDRPKRRLYEALRSQGFQPNQQVVFLSDGADTLRRLQDRIAPEAEHVLDWFHIAMRFTLLGQMVKGAWSDSTAVEKPLGMLERAKWRLWNGDAPRACDMIDDLADAVANALDATPTSAALRKLAAAVGEFATYIANNAGFIVDYGERYRAGERISTGFVESAVNQIVDKRFDKKQSMRFTPRGAHLLPQTRTRVLNGDLDGLFRQRYPAFRRPSLQTSVSHGAPAL